LQYTKNKLKKPSQALEDKHKSDLLPSERDGMDWHEAEYWNIRNFVYYVCNGSERPDLLQRFWEELDYYELFELFIHHTIYGIRQS